MSQVLPVAFWQQGRDEPEGYVWCRHLKRYLRWQFSNCEVLEFVDAVGYPDYNHFEHALNDWLNLSKPIPAAFMRAIGVDVELLKCILEIDQKEFDQSLLRPTPPKLFWIEDVDACHLPQPLPFGTTLTEAIAYIERYLLSRPDTRAYLHWPYLQTILFEHGQATLTVAYRPELRLEQAHYSFGKDGSTLPVSTNCSHR